jgi:hypothetical protein
LTFTKCIFPVPEIDDPMFGCSYWLKETITVVESTANIFPLKFKRSLFEKFFFIGMEKMR